MARTNRPPSAFADQRAKGVKLFEENPHLKIREVMEILGIDSTKRNRWMVEKWKDRALINREKVRIESEHVAILNDQVSDWERVLELCPDTATLGGLLIDGFTKKISEVTKRATKAEKDAENWKDDAHQWREHSQQLEAEKAKVREELEADVVRLQEENRQLRRPVDVTRSAFLV